jgi:hypothetical protein
LSIRLTPYDDPPLCSGNTWEIDDIDALAEEIARVAVGQAEHVAEIYAAAGMQLPKTTPDAKSEAIELLTVVGEPYHRDGWLFQVLSWIAAHRHTTGGLIRAPQMLLAHKGFDGIQVELSANPAVSTFVVIFEDKATENPRSTIRDGVWPEFRELEKGRKQHVLAAEVSALLKSAQGVNATSAINDIVWAQARKYRVAITIESGHEGTAGRKRLFKDFDDVAPGNNQRRRAETLTVQNLRAWMDSLATLVIAKIRLLPV